VFIVVPEGDRLTVFVTMVARVVDRHHLGANPDPDPDSTFYFNADLDPTLKLGKVNPFLSIIF